jgi:hypothetical protein
LIGLIRSSRSSEHHARFSWQARTTAGADYVELVNKEGSPRCNHLIVLLVWM